jgi:hypothetical protein
MVNWKDVIVRALKTFAQTAGSYLIANLSGVNFFESQIENFWLGLGLSAGAAGISAAWNIIMEAIKNK